MNLLGKNCYKDKLIETGKLKRLRTLNVLQIKSRTVGTVRTNLSTCTGMIREYRDGIVCI
jgi:hypothetical protein